jgi:hypothetical protein
MLRKFVPLVRCPVVSYLGRLAWKVKSIIARCCCNVVVSYVSCFRFWMLWSRRTGRVSILLPRGMPVNFNVVSFVVWHYTLLLLRFRVSEKSDLSVMLM